MVSREMKRVVVDSRFRCLEHGDAMQALDQFAFGKAFNINNLHDDLQDCP